MIFTLVCCVSLSQKDLGRNTDCSCLADTRRGECILGFYVRSGFWIDGIQLLTSCGRKSEIYGNAHGGSA